MPFDIKKVLNGAVFIFEKLQQVEYPVDLLHQSILFK